MGGMWRAKPYRVVVLAVLSGAGVFCAWDSWVSLGKLLLSCPGRDDYWVSAKGPKGIPWPKEAASVCSSSWLGSRGRGMRFKRGVRRAIRDQSGRDLERSGRVFPRLLRGTVLRTVRLMKSHG